MTRYELEQYALRLAYKMASLHHYQEKSAADRQIAIAALRFYRERDRVSWGILVEKIEDAINEGGKT